MTPILSVIGATALWLFYGWLASAIIASYLSGRKGYGEKIGLAFGLLLTVVGVIVWLLVPAREGSDWKTIGVFGHTKKADRQQAEVTEGPDMPGEVGTGR